MINDLYRVFKKGIEVNGKYNLWNWIEKKENRIKKINNTNLTYIFS